MQQKLEIEDEVEIKVVACCNKKLWHEVFKINMLVEIVRWWKNIFGKTLPRIMEGFDII